MHCIVDERLEFDVDWKTLHTPSQAVEPTEDVTPLIAKLLYGVRVLNGQGLAAPQIGELKRVVVARLGNYWVPMINPRLVNHGRDVETKPEGCLSTEGHVVHVPRFRIVEVEFERHTDRQVEHRRLTGNDARITQHELDHLDGRLIVDLLP